MPAASFINGVSVAPVGNPLATVPGDAKLPVSTGTGPFNDANVVNPAAVKVAVVPEIEAPLSASVTAFNPTVPFGTKSPSIWRIPNVDS